MGWHIESGSYPRLLQEEPAKIGCFANAQQLTQLRFRGTVPQWEQVECGADWTAAAPLARIVCDNGTILKKTEK
ncbi:MAG: hypothetical protein E7502_04760 [Ruminococcus sp.]|nr:hypothetical protein [Ruminococcus sp.]